MTLTRPEMSGLLTETSKPATTTTTIPYVINRKGEREPIKFDKITKRLDMLIRGEIAIKHKTLYHIEPLLGISAVTVTQYMLSHQGITNGATTSKIDGFTATAAAALVMQHPNYGFLAARIFMSNLHKQTDDNYLLMLHRAQAFEKETQVPLMTPAFLDFVTRHAEKIQKALRYERDFLLDYRGCRTLADQSYLWQSKSGIIFERPQHLWMRVACHLYSDVDDIESALSVYESMSLKKFIHATPTLFNAAHPHPQLASCFLLRSREDSMQGICDTITQCAMISKSSGGIGVSVTDIRAQGSTIRGSNGTSKGLGPMLRVYNEIARYADQGGNKRKGAFAPYVEPWHADIELFLTLKLAKTNPYVRCEDLHPAIWAPDLFFKRVIAQQPWSLFCPTEVQRKMGYRLQDYWGDEFESRYVECERLKLYRKQVSALGLFEQMVVSMSETGEPYLLAKDACNRKSNHRHLGCIQSSNLCTEIIEYTSRDEIAVCNLASLCLSTYTTEWPIYVTHWINPLVMPKDSPLASSFHTTTILPDSIQQIQTKNTRALLTMSGLGERYFPQFPESIQMTIVAYLDCSAGLFDFHDFSLQIRQVVRNLNRAIDINEYSLPETKNSNLKHRPIGIGVQAFADMLVMLRMSWTPRQYVRKASQQSYLDDRALQMNRRVFETLYYYALDESCNLAAKAAKRGKIPPYESYPGSPVSQGILQMDMWPTGVSKTSIFCDWDGLRQKIKLHGVYNSLLVAPMPTETTSHILGSSALFEPYRNLMYRETTLKGDYIRQNKYFFNNILLELGVWNNAHVAQQLMDALSKNSWCLKSTKEKTALDWLPAAVRNVFETTWELSPRLILEFTADRAPFVDQSQSFNAHHPIHKSDVDSIMEYLLEAWKLGLKTLSYYTHRQPSVKTADFGKMVLKAAEEAAKVKEPGKEEDTKSRKNRSAMTDLEAEEKNQLLDMFREAMGIPAKKSVSEKQQKPALSFLDMVEELRQVEIPPTPRNSYVSSSSSSSVIDGVGSLETVDLAEKCTSCSS
jgi:ribonucleoside-diphosphate reductase subunit M1